MSSIHIPGFPRIGARRELKKALENYWRGEIDQASLLETGRKLRRQNWTIQSSAGLDWITVGDFSWYDHVLDHSVMLGVVPQRFDHQQGDVDIDTYFTMARGRAPNGPHVQACEMTKWFDSNYHYLVPEFSQNQPFSLSSQWLFEALDDAIAQGHNAKPVLLGPLSYLWLGKTRGGTFNSTFNKLDLINTLLPVYIEVLNQLQIHGATWVQIDEPILALDLPQSWRAAFEPVYDQLNVNGLKTLLTVYFGALKDNIELACSLNVDGLHIDAVRGKDDIDTLLAVLPEEKILSLGVIDGRNIWRADLDSLLKQLRPIKKRLRENLWISTSCSLLHVPVDLAQEPALPADIRQWLAFALQKLDELQLLKQALNNDESDYSAHLKTQLEHSRNATYSRRHSSRVYNDSVKRRCGEITREMTERHSPFSVRRKLQQNNLQLPMLPTTTIGSFPQTETIRRVRKQFKSGDISAAEYVSLMKQEIALAIDKQEHIGLDVLVHGEPERNDMVEYFGELLEGFVFTSCGWVQSYGSRCVKPPIIYGDISRPKPMTVEWGCYAQSLTEKPVKGMLTGPVTILNWSFVRDDQPKSETCRQLALALRDEVCDLEKAGIRIIQIDEAALREGLPLRKSEWQHYLDWAVQAFKITASGVTDDTQIHTHMCYSEFNDIMPDIAAMDADVITIETSRSDLELLQAFKSFHYPNDMGPGVYDIHSPNVPTEHSIRDLLVKALQHIPADRLWVNPDCGLKTRGWPEVEKALINMVNAAKIVRSELD